MTNQKQLNPRKAEDALAILASVAAEYKGTFNEHVVFQTCLETLDETIKANERMNATLMELNSDDTEDED
jgi:hypothetical protein